MNNLNIDLSIAEKYLHIAVEKFTWYRVLVDESKVINFIFGNDNFETDPIKQSVLLDLLQKYNTKAYIVKCNEEDAAFLYQALQACTTNFSCVEFFDNEGFVYDLANFYDSEISEVLEVCTEYSASIFELKELSNINKGFKP